MVGLPINMSGVEGDWAKEVRAWGGRLGLALNLPVSFRDERLSSFSAEEHLGLRRPHTRRKRERQRAQIDAEAAAIILQDELIARRN